MAEIEYIEIDPVSRKILSPAGMLLGVMEDADSERKYFKCPKIVGDDIDLSQFQIYFKYTQATDKDGTKFETKEPGIYHCDDVNDEGDYITFSWKLSGNVFLEKGFIAFSMFASDGDVVKWGTTTAVGTVLITIPGGLEEVAERYPDIISQLLNRMDEVEAIATPEAMQNYVEAYLIEHPAELDETLTDNTKAAPAGMVGEMKEEISSLSEEIANKTGTGLSTEAIDKLEEVGNYLAYTTADGGSKWTELISILRNGSSGGSFEPIVVDNIKYLFGKTCNNSFGITNNGSRMLAYSENGILPYSNSEYYPFEIPEGAKNVTVNCDGLRWAGYVYANDGTNLKSLQQFADGTPQSIEYDGATYLGIYILDSADGTVTVETDTDTSGFSVVFS